MRKVLLFVMIVLVPVLAFGQLWLPHEFPVLESRPVSSSICGDFDNDGDMDLIVNTIQPSGMFYVENIDAENFEWASVYIQDDARFGLYTCDIDGDGDLDVYSIGNRDQAQDYFSWDLNVNGDGSGWEGGGATGFDGDAVRGIAHEDFDQDGDMDMVGTGTNHPLFTWENRLSDGGWFENQTELNLLPSAQHGKNMCAGDVDGDGDRDLVLHAYNIDTGYSVIALVIYDGNGTYSLGGTHSIDHDVRDLKLGDLNNDGLLDVICTTGWDSDPIYTYFTSEDGGDFNWDAQTITSQTDSGWDFLQTADIDSDGDIDLMVRDADMLRFFENLDGMGTDWTANLISVLPDDHYHRVNLGDLNGDMMPDAIHPNIGDGFTWKANPYEYNAVDEAGAVQPTDFELLSVYPNPFNPTTNVSVVLPKPSELSVSVYDVQGKRVAELANGTFGVGEHDFTFNASTLSSGVYFVRAMVPGEQNAVHKVMLLK